MCTELNLQIERGNTKSKEKSIQDKLKQRARTNQKSPKQLNVGAMYDKFNKEKYTPQLAVATAGSFDARRDLSLLPPASVCLFTLTHAIPSSPPSL